MDDFTPRNPSGYVPGAEFVNGGDPYGVKVAIITRVDEHELKCDLKIITGGGERYEVDLTQAMSGPRSFFGGIPEVNSLVLIGYRRKHKQLHEAVILGYLNNGLQSGRRFDPLTTVDPSEISPEDAENYRKIFSPQVRYKALKLRPGDIGGMSAAGSEFVLSDDVRMVNRAGDLYELRDSDRTLVQQAIHRVDSSAGVFSMSGPARRSGLYLPPDIIDKQTFKGQSDRFFGSGILKRFTSDGTTLLDAVNNYETFPPVTYSNGRQAYYPSTFVAVNFEDPDAAGAEPYTEDRLELTHTTDLVQEVREEIDGFQADRKPVYIERILGTLIGNDTSSLSGIQQYGELLRPKIFEEFLSTGSANFSTEAITRTALDDIESYTTAGAYMLRINPPPPPGGRKTSVGAFAAAVSKQGKLFVNIPGSSVEQYPSGTTNVSAEVNMGGALKMRLGAAKPDNIALHLTLEGGAIFDFRSASSGAGLTFKTHSSYIIEAQGVPDNNNLAFSENLQGNRESFTSADSTEQVQGSKITNVSGGYQVLADRHNINATSGFSLNAGSIDVLSAGKSQFQFAQDVTETIVTGGKTSTIMQGGLSETAVVGDRTADVLGGSYTTNVLAGDYKVQVGAGSITMSTTAGSMTLQAVAGSISMTAGLAVSVTAGTTIELSAPTSVTLTSAQVFVGGSGATLGVCRGLASLPAGSPTLDPITGSPLFGSATFRSLL